MRKHYTQMTSAELSALRAKVRDISQGFRNNVPLAPHCKERLVERHVRVSDVMQTVAEGVIIEAHCEKGTLRVMLTKHFTRYRIACVLDLETKTIVTAMQNSPNDNHKTLDWTPYTWQENLVEVCAAL